MYDGRKYLTCVLCTKPMDMPLGTTKSVFPDACPHVLFIKHGSGIFFFPGRTCADNSPRLSLEKKTRHGRDVS